MPMATVNIEETLRHELKSAPPDGYVVLRRMAYGQIIQRRSMNTMSVEARKGQKDFRGELAMANTNITAYEFKHCIIDHNLTDRNGDKLDLARFEVFSQLDPRIGQEIEKYIAEMHSFEDDDEGN